MLHALEAQLPIYWVPVLKSLYNSILSVTQGPTIWVPGLLGMVSCALNYMQTHPILPPEDRQSMLYNIRRHCRQILSSGIEREHGNYYNGL